MIRAGLESCFFSGAHLMAKPFLGGLGVIFTLHHVRAESDDPFQPNRILEVTPEFLDAALGKIRRSDLDIVDLDEAVRRLTTPGPHRRFVVITFDDGYRDNREIAWHILRRHKAPFTVYVPTAFPDGRGDLWWAALEAVIRAQDAVAVDLEGVARLLETATAEDKHKAFETVYWAIRHLPERQRSAVIRDLCTRYSIDQRALCADFVMRWDELAEMARDPLVTIGAHTIDHVALARLPMAEARRQMRESARTLEAVIDRPVRHFSFPYGDAEAAGPREFALARELGFASAVTTRPGLIYPEHAGHLTALPRVSLNGDYQSLRYLDVFLSGLPFFVFNGFERLNVA